MSSLSSFIVFTAFAATYGKQINELWYPFDEKIVGGVNTVIEEHPYQVSIQVNNRHSCGGSLIRPNVVLTAAHCMARPIDTYSVRAGSTFKERGGQVLKAVKACTHPKYGNTDYDVSVFKLEKPFQLNSAVQFINLQDVNVELPVGAKAVVTGWGTLQWGSPSSPSALQKVDLPKVNQINCAITYAYFNRNITKRMACYGYTQGGKDSCQGDSGGPLVANGKQVGIVSWGYRCAIRDVPGVYVNLGNKEIHDHIIGCLKNF